MLYLPLDLNSNQIEFNFMEPSKRNKSIRHNEAGTAMIVERKKKELQEELEAISRDYGIDAVFTLVQDPTNNYNNTVISSSSSSSAAAVEEEFQIPNLDNFSQEELSEMLVRVEEKKKTVAAKIAEIKKKKNKR